MNLKGKGGIGVPSNWSITFGIAITMLWSWRNASLFDRNFVRSLNPVEKILHCWRNFALGPYPLSDSPLISDLPHTAMVGCWQKPPHGWNKLNVDGAVALNSSKAGCGGLLRDGGGIWLCGFCC
ncbi:hypothetical protein K1719_043382 [Acacia pycnantha]|nr:hypothetical protein K1719_043382 [Acacia pycnantha]